MNGLLSWFKRRQERRNAEKEKRTAQFQASTKERALEVVSEDPLTIIFNYQCVIDATLAFGGAVLLPATGAYLEQGRQIVTDKLAECFPGIDFTTEVCGYFRNIPSKYRAVAKIN